MAVIGVGILSIIFAVISLTGMLFPDSLKYLATLLGFVNGFWLSVILRFLAGLLLWFAADSSRAPFILKSISVLILIGGVILLVSGSQNYISFPSWLAEKSDTIKRIGFTMAFIASIYILWAILPSKNTDNSLD